VDDYVDTLPIAGVMDCDFIDNTTSEYRFLSSENQESLRELA